MAPLSDYWVGLISDTHGLLRQEALDALRGCSLILHAGDVGELSVLDGLGSIAPVRAVRGNVDRGEVAARLQPTEIVEVAGQQVYLIHDLGRLDLDAAAAGFAAVVYGHSHIASVREEGGVLYVNPGAAGPGRFDLRPSVGRLLLTAGRLRAEILELRF
jgi:uncharacterized protein